MVKKIPPVIEETTVAPGEGVQIGTFLPDAPAAPEAFAHLGDEHWGQGGRYLVVDGQRVPAPLTDNTEANHG